ncbi:hypothetical protein AVEN_42521-1, partial [Araneus ventricosus]
MKLFVMKPQNNLQKPEHNLQATRWLCSCQKDELHRIRHWSEQRLTNAQFLEKSSTPTLKRAVSCDSIMSNSSVAAEALESPHHCGELELGL